MLPELLLGGVNGLSWMLQWGASPVAIDQTQPVIDKNAVKKVFRYGPFNLQGSKYPKVVTPITMDDNADIIIRTLKGLPSNAAILSGRLDTIFENGTRMDVSNGVYIHHLLVADVGKSSAPFALCPNGHNQKTFSPWISSYIVESIGAGLIQAGNDQVSSVTVYASPNGPMKSAFQTGPDDTFLLQSEIVNYNAENVTIYMALEVEYLETIPTNYLDASVLVFSATGCNSPGYKPPGIVAKYNFTSEPFLMDRDGYILNMRGHLHDGGTSIQFLLENKLVCESFPKYENLPGAKKPDGSSWQTITEMSYCDQPIKFKKGDKAVLVSKYDTDLHPLRAGTASEGAAAQASASGGTEKPGGHGDKPGGHGGMEGMDMAEEMGIFIVNIASEQQKRLPAPKNGQNGPKSAPVAPVRAQSSGFPSATPSNMPMGDHGHIGKNAIRSLRFDINNPPQAAYPV